MKIYRTERHADTLTATELYRESLPDYSFDGDVMREDSPRAARVKWIMENRLEASERIMMTLYFEMQSAAKVAKMLGKGRSKTAEEIKRIREKILAEYGKFD